MDALEQAPSGPERTPLPSGGWVELKDPKTLKARDKKSIMRSIKGTPDADHPVGFAVDMTDGLIVHMVTGWYLPYGQDWPIPAHCVTFDQDTGAPTVLDELEIADYDKLTECVKPAQELLFPSPVTPDDYDKPGSPTRPAAG